LHTRAQTVSSKQQREKEEKNKKEREGFIVMPMRKTWLLRVPEIQEELAVSDHLKT
jgi:hypothetical protein